ncbi:hypothetical protein [Vampirovibrio chlorellavorus]|uniref:hypothetical protein n=1 Tax=Vampirovibrio chlorellavorus TaxID=758823 RepID=UPI0026F1BDDA|nr:hypothetical protein [Vampirovibrio chlorellavorus]
MNFYLLRHDGTISDAGDYPQQPEAREEGSWQPGRPPVNSLELQPLTEQLRLVFETDLPAEMQADLAPLKAAVKMELEQNRPHIARLIIQRATIPEALEALRQGMLSLLPESPPPAPET